MKITSCF